MRAVRNMQRHDLPRSPYTVHVFNVRLTATAPTTVEQDPQRRAAHSASTKFISTGP
jgi:hypothetical protein